MAPALYVLAIGIVALALAVRLKWEAIVLKRDADARHAAVQRMVAAYRSEVRLSMLAPRMERALRRCADVVDEIDLPRYGACENPDLAADAAVALDDARRVLAAVDATVTEELPATFTTVGGRS